LDSKNRALFCVSYACNWHNDRLCSCYSNTLEVKGEIIMKRILVLTFGVASYLIFFRTFLHACGFIGNLLVPKSNDSERQSPLGEALLINAV
jgi:hypothetical protein